MDWRNIPSLSALRAFEAAARLQSLTKAAQALNVTHAAISQHVRMLEADLGTDLLIRAGRGVALTEAGQHLAQALQDGFGRISEGVGDLRNKVHQRPLVISLTPAFAENWLVPRLAGFWTRHPEVALSLRPSTALADLKQDGIDLAIRYGPGHWPGFSCTPLTKSHIVAAAAPSVLAGSAQKAWSAYPWFLSQNFPEARRWAESEGHLRPHTRVTLLDSDTLVLSALRQGLGLSAQTFPVIEADLASGALVQLAANRDEGFGYHLVRRPGPPAPALTAFIDWVLSVV